MRTHDLGVRAWKARADTFGRRLSGGTFTAPKHVRLIAWLLSCNASGHLRRLGLSQPPGTGKSEVVDYYDSGLLLEHDHRRRIVVASYSGELVEEQGKRVRNLIEDNAEYLTVRLMQDSRAADRWRTTKGGGMWTVGVGGSLTGRRASNFKIDDPHKNFAEAMSELQQTTVWDWYKSTARTRLLPRAPLIVVQTRWAEGDLIGRLTSLDENRGDWCFVKLPAIAEEDESIESVLGMSIVGGEAVPWATRLRAAGLILPDWRRDKGEALWPELEPGVPWFDVEEYTDIRHEVGEVVWAGLYQQRPAPMEGGLFKRGDWRRLDAGLPRGRYLFVRRWDFAATEGAGDWTAGCLMAMNRETRMLYIVEMRRARLAWSDVKQYVKITAQEDKERYGHVLIRAEQEPGSAGKGVASDLMADMFAGLPAKFIRSTGEKPVRALPLSGQVGAGNVYLCRRPVGEGEWVVPDWWQWLIEEAAVFPNGKNDDLVDVASLAYVDCIEELPRKRRAQIGSSARKTLGF
jgi:predicted phage terminase large subunit-like protein